MARREDFRDGIALYARQVTVGAGHTLAAPLVFENSDPKLCKVTVPFTVLKTQAAQQLMDELWQCGLRPSEGTGSAGSLAATEKHLADMRAIAFNRLKIEVV